MKSHITLLALFLAAVLLITACGIRPIPSEPAQSGSADTSSPDTSDVQTHSPETVVFENNRSSSGLLMTLELDDGSYLDYNFQRSWLPEGHLDVRFQLTEWKAGGFCYIYSYQAGAENRFPLLEHNGFTYFDVDVPDEGFSKGALTVSPVSKKVFWAKQEYLDNQQWAFGEDGILRVVSTSKLLNGLMFYLDPEKGPCVSDTNYTVLTPSVWFAREHKDYNIPEESLNFEELGLPVPESYIAPPMPPFD